MQLTFDAIPETYEEFKTAAQQGLAQPERVAGLFLMALNLYVKDTDAGIRALNDLRGPRPLNNYDIQFLRDRLRDKPYLPLAYFGGATPQNSYVPALPPVLSVLPDTQPQEAGYIKLFLKTAGADSARPLKLRQKGSEWFLWEYSSILLGIRIPANQDPWA